MRNPNLASRWPQQWRGFWASGRQQWRLWKFPYIWSTEFYQTVIKRLGGKARCEPVWLWDCGWNITRLPCPEFRQPGYYTPDLDWSRGNPFNFHEEYKAGYDRGFEDGLQKGGKAAGKGKAEDGLQKGG